ncbi:MAG: 2-oxoacid:acceptor oxidoreductase family protein, partial [Candidatus Paceibacterota bacterium]
MNRLRIKVAGQSGSGLLSVGEILINSFKELGYNVVADREYPSLIKGGYSCFSINVSDKEIKGLSNKADIMLSIDKESMEAYFDTLEKGGILVHGYERLFGIKDLIEKAKKRDIKVVHQMVRSIAKEKGASILMTNVILTGIFWKTLGLDY